MKLGIYLETIFLYSDNLYCEDIYTLNLNELSSNFEYIFLGRNRKQASCNTMYQVKSYVNFFEIDYYSSLVSLFKRLPAYILKNKIKIKNFVLSCDKLLIMTPSPVSILLIKYAIKYNKPYCLLIRQDSRIMIPARYKGIQKTAAKVLANFLESTVEKSVKKNNSRVLALGPVIFNRYAKLSNRVYEFASSRYKTKDIVEPNNFTALNFKGKVKILFVGRIEINKGIIELLNALSEFENFELTLVGDGQYMAEVKNKVSELSLQQKVKILGYIPFGPELLKIFSKHEIFILPSYSEGLPQVILEAMASGCLVLASDVGSIPYIIQDKENGFLFQPKSTSSIFELFQTLKQNQYNYDVIRKNALQTAKVFAFENQSKILLNAINS